MRVQDFFELRVGRVILGKKLLVHIRSKNSSNFSLSFICKRFILKSPTIAAYLFSFCSVLIIGEISSINLSILALLLLLCGPGCCQGRGATVPQFFGPPPWIGAHSHSHNYGIVHRFCSPLVIEVGL